jgi:hypothetical protein
MQPRYPADRPGHLTLGGRDKLASTRHRAQYFEMIGHRSIDHDGWRAVGPWPGPCFAEADKPFGAPITAETLTRPRCPPLGATMSPRHGS